ncbi:MAG TPA: hypothetical protein VF420_07730 [Casimicrobiaceae bacterium]
MKMIWVTLLAGASCAVSLPALADDASLINEMNMKPLTATQSAQLRAERDAAKAKWATMTADQKTSITQQMRNKKLGDLNAVEKYAQNDDMTAMTKSENAQMKAQHDAAKAKWAAMTPDEKAAVRKAMQQKRLADLNDLEKVGQADDMGRYFSY